MSVFLNQVGLSISEDRLQLIEIVKKDNQLFLENVDEEFFEENINPSIKESKFIHILQNSFNEIVLRKPLQSKTVSITLPQSFFKVFELPVDKNLTKNDLNEYISWELTKLFPQEKRDYFTFRKIVPDSANFLSFKRVIVFATPINVLQRLHKFCMRNNLKLKFVDHPHTSLFGFLMNQSGANIYLSLYVDSFQISLLLYSNNSIVFESHSTYNNINEVADKIYAIKDEIYKRNLITEKIEKIFVFGNSITNELKNNIQSKLESPVTETNPFDKLNITSELKENNFVKEQAIRFSQATALILRI